MVRYCRPLKVLCIFFTVLAAGLPGLADAQDSPVNLTLRQAIKMAVEKNLDVKAELYNPASAEADIRKNKGIYDPLLTFLTNYQESNTLPASTFLSGASVSRQRFLEYNAGINQLIPFGGTLGLEFGHLRMYFKKLIDIPTHIMLTWHLQYNSILGGCHYGKRRDTGRHN